MRPAIDRLNAYLAPLLGLTMPIKMYRSTRLSDGSFLAAYVCSVNDCGTDLIDDQQLTYPGFAFQPATVSDEGDDQIARIEQEPGPTPSRLDDPPAGWYLRGIRMTTKVDGSDRVEGGKFKLQVTAAGSSDSVEVKVIRPWHLGAQTDGYPVTYKVDGVDTDFLLEDVIVKYADLYGIPPHYLMSQLTKEAARVTKHGELRYNPYSYRYEPWAFDFLNIVGDVPFPNCCWAGQHKVLQDPAPAYEWGFPFFRSALPGGLVEYLPEATGGDSPPGPLIRGLSPIGDYPTAEFHIDDLTGPIRWQVSVVDLSGGPTLSQAMPGHSPAPGEYAVVDYSTGVVQFGEPLDAGVQLQATMTPVGRLTSSAAGLGSALASATSLDDILENAGTNEVLPPAEADRDQTILGWAVSRPTCGTNTLVQNIHRYGIDFLAVTEDNCALLRTDLSFDLQGQWYAGASLGMLQVWPANAQTTIQNAPTSPVDRRAELRSVFNPLREPGTKLFHPDLGTRFGAAGDVYVDVRSEAVPTEPPGVYPAACTAPVTSSPFNSCTWGRWWARKFAAFRRGHDDSDCQPNGQDCEPGVLRDYGRPIVENASTFAPQPPPLQ
jgi:hypothetical protein